jgi:hypothetical protein
MQLRHDKLDAPKERNVRKKMYDLLQYVGHRTRNRRAYRRRRRRRRCRENSNANKSTTTTPFKNTRQLPVMHQRVTARKRRSCDMNDARCNADIGTGQTMMFKVGFSVDTASQESEHRMSTFQDVTLVEHDSMKRNLTRTTLRTKNKCYVQTIVVRKIESSVCAR